MARTLTIVACRPDANHDDVRDGNGDGSIQGALDVLHDRHDHTNHVVMRASSVQSLIARLKAYALLSPAQPRPDLLQIIGHGLPGMLLLGKTWTDVRYKDGGHVYALDSNVWHYGALSDDIGPPTSVLLLGCAVGDAQAITASDGPTLLFDLSHMWRCAVSAPVGFVKVAELKEGDGIYPYTADDYRDRMTSVVNDVLTMGVAPESIVAGSSTVNFMKLTGAPAFGIDARVQLELTSGPGVVSAQRLGHLVGPSVPLSSAPQFAYPELTFDVVTADGAAWEAAVLCNARRLRLTPAGGGAARLFAISPLARPEFKRLLRDLASKAGVTAI